MRVTGLPSPGILSQAILLRTEAAKAISSVEIVSSKYPGGVSAQATRLHAFFTACATAIAALRDVTAPTITARNQATGAKVTTDTFSERMAEDVIPAASAFTFAPANPIVAVRWAAGKDNVLEIETTNSNAGGATLAYTQPGTNGLRDYGGNLVATSAATAITIA